MTKFKDLPAKIQDRMLEEHTPVRYNLDVSISPVFQKKDKLLREFKEEWNKAMMGACMDKTPMIEESRFVLSTDTYGIPTYVLARVTGKSVEIILNKSIHDKVSFEEEVSNLQKYFNAKLIK